jgi:hypothetical protein
MAQIRFQGPECGMGDHEVGPMVETEIYSVVCLEEHGRAIRLHCWEEEPAQPRLREDFSSGCWCPKRCPAWRGTLRADGDIQPAGPG